MTSKKIVQVVALLALGVAVLPLLTAAHASAQANVDPNAAASVPAAPPVAPVAAPVAAPASEPPIAARPRRPVSRWARAELATVQTVVGAAIGLEFCGIVECGESRAWAGAALVGAGGGLGLSLLTTRDGIAAGRALAVDDGALVGTWLGAGMYFAASPHLSGSPEAPLGMMIGGQLAGAGLGLLADSVYALSPGEVSLATSGALWTGVVSALALAAIAPDGDGDPMRRRFFGTTLVTTSAALVGGAWLGRRDHVSRGRALLVDVGALAGAAGLPLLGWLAGGDGADGSALLWSSAAGALGGAATAYFLTRGWDGPDVPPVSMSVSPTQGGALAQVSLAL